MKAPFLELSMLPNINNYKFNGVTKDGRVVPCAVKKGEDGLHFVVNEITGERFFTQLTSWFRLVGSKI